MSLSMGMHMRLQQVLIPMQVYELKQELRLESKYLSSSFVLTEEWLIQNGNSCCFEVDTDVEWISLIDAIFCTLYPYYKRNCEKFYDGYGKPLKFVMSKSKLKYYDQQMVSILEKFKRG